VCNAHGCNSTGQCASIFAPCLSPALFDTHSLLRAVYHAPAAPAAIATLPPAGIPNQDVDDVVQDSPQFGLVLLAGLHALTILGTQARKTQQMMMWDSRQ